MDHTGHLGFLPNHPAYIQFIPHRIPGRITDLSDMNHVAIHFKVLRTHFFCLRPHSWEHLVISEQGHSSLHPQLFVHPSISEGGWATITRFYQKTMRLQIPSLVPFPQEPWFWTGALLSQQPPSFFNQWIQIVSSGGQLSLDPGDLYPALVRPPSSHLCPMSP